MWAFESKKNKGFVKTYRHYDPHECYNVNDLKKNCNQILGDCYKSLVAKFTVWNGKLNIYIENKKYT